MKRFLCFTLLTTLYFCSHAQINLSNGLVAYYPFNGDDKDHSGMGNNPVFDNAVPAAGYGGLPNTGYYFDGATSYMQILNNTGLNFTNTITLYALFKPMGFNYGNCHGNNVLEKGQDGFPGQYSLRFDDAVYTNNQNCSGGAPDSLHENINIFYATGQKTYAPYIEKGDWYSVFYVADGQNVRLYINCELVMTTVQENTQTFTNTNDLFIGMENVPGYPYFFNGVIDEVRIYNRALDLEEIHALSVPSCPVGPCLPNYADFNISQPSCNGQSMQFAAAGPDSILSTKWSLGDGSTDNTNTVNHTSTATGNYPVKMVVQYTSGCTDSVTKLIPVSSAIADPTVINSNDTTICAGSQLVLQALPNEPGYCWSPGISLSNTTILNPVATPQDTTIYYCTSPVLKSNLVFNGDFASGDTGFTSDYYAVNPEVSPAEYHVGASPSSWYPSSSNCVDHTTGSGNMMMVAGYIGFAKVWSQTVSVSPNTNYLFSTWIQSISSSSAASLQFSINGAVMPGNINAPASTCSWNQYGTVWNSGDSTTAILSLVSQNQLSGSLFALDDISFSQYALKYDSVKINIAPYPNLQTRADTTICGTYSVPLFAKGATGYSWSPGAKLADSTTANPLAPTSKTTQYVVTGYIYKACTVTDTVTVTVLPLPLFSMTPDSQIICQQTPFTLKAAGGNTYQWSSVTQGQGLSSDSVYSSSGITTDTFSVAIYNSTCLLNDTLRSIVTVDTIPILSVAKSNDIDCSDGSSTLTVSGGSNYTWTPSATLRNANTTAPVATPSISTWYTVSVTNGACSTQDSIQLLVDFGGETSKFSVPDAFTPNGDGINDCFMVKYWGTVKSFELSVFNRWGVRVFYTQNLSDCWDGTFHGVQQPSGAYVYQIKASSPCAASGYIFRKGTLALIR